MPETRTCFNCGQKYQLYFDNSSIASQLDGFCSKECEQQDNTRLVEGNGIIAQAELYAKQNEQSAFTDLNKLKLDTVGPSNIGNTLGKMLHFGSNTVEIKEPVND